MTKTQNYSLPQWESTDALKRADFNEAMASIDTGLAVAAPPEYISVDTTGKVNGDTLCTFTKAPRFVIVWGTYACTVLSPDNYVYVIDYTTHVDSYGVTFVLSDTTLKMTYRKTESAFSTMQIVAFY